MPDLIIKWWPSRELSRVDLDSIRSGLIHNRRYFGDAELRVMDDSTQPPGSVCFSGDHAMEVEIGKFIRLAEAYSE